MSESRKFLTAKRKNERTSHNNVQNTRNLNFDGPKHGTKRPGTFEATPKRNLANDRLKRLRTSLNEDAKTKSAGAPKVRGKKYDRKRPQNSSFAQSVSCKQPKQSRNDIPNKSSAFTFKQEFLDKREFSFGDVSVFSRTNTAVSSKSDEGMEWCPVDSNSETTFDAPELNMSEQVQNEFLIVVDTNVFLSNLKTIKDIVSMKITGNMKPIIFIPWIVLEELDFIKEDNRTNTVRHAAQEAIKYVRSIQSAKIDRLRGQTMEEVNQLKSVGKSQDNKIIASCLQVLEKNKNMVLITGDINLKNKAYFNNIPVCSHNEITAKIAQYHKTKYDRITHLMVSLCSTVIKECATNAYGPAYSKMPIGQTPLTTIGDCLSIFKKYWFAVFQEVLMKQFKKAVDDLSVFLEKNIKISDQSNEINEFMRLCVRLCLFLKDVECCKAAIEKTICDLNEIKES